jgi:hypothetical protein
LGFFACQPISPVRGKTSMRDGPEGIAEAPEKKSGHQQPPPGDQHSSQSRLQRRGIAQRLDFDRLSPCVSALVFRRLLGLARLKLPILFR